MLGQSSISWFTVVILHLYNDHGQLNFSNDTKFKPLTKSESILENSSSKLLCSIIFSLLSDQFSIPCFITANLQSEYHWKAKFWNNCKLGLKKLHSKVFQKSSASSCCLTLFSLSFKTNHHHSLFCNGQFTMIWIPLAAKLLNSHLIESKKLYLYPKIYCKDLKTGWQVAVWRHFAIVAHRIHHSLFYNGQFTIR